MLLYFYRSVSGTIIPKTTDKDAARLVHNFTGSRTPLIRVLSVTTANEAMIAVELLQMQLTHTSKKETGLIFSINQCIESLLNPASKES